MKIPIRRSALMDDESQAIGSLENRLIRMPAEMREMFEKDLGDFINLRTLKGNILSLRISRAYLDDVSSDAVVAYVTSNVFSRLSLNDLKERALPEVAIMEGMTLGCDPELFLVSKHDGRIIHPTDMKFLRSGDVGSDGDMLEIRPIPSTDEWVVAANIWSCLRKARLMLDKVKKPDGKSVIMVSSSCYRGVTAGFHLHFGIPKELWGGNKAGTRRYAVKDLMAKVMDYYVGLTSIMPEGEQDAIRRSNLDIPYGKPGQWRQESVTFEYRVPGGYMLRHPILTVGLLGLGAIVMEDVLSRVAACTDSFKDLSVLRTMKDIKEIYPNVPDVFELYQAGTSISTKPARAHLDKIVDDLKKMVGFEKRVKSINKMFQAIYAGTKFRPDIEGSWRLFYNEKQQRSVDVLSARK